jgi:hypothetical protein
MKIIKRTFSETVSALEGPNSEALMAKASNANSIAKSVRGKARRRAYSVKAAALTALRMKLPSRVRIRHDNRINDYIVVELKHLRRGLHYPAALV